MKAKKMIVPILMGVLMAFAILPMTAGKAYAEDYELWVGGTKVTNANAGDVLKDGKVKFKPASGNTPATLTLDSATITGVYDGRNIISKIQDLTINVKGKNSLSGGSVGIEADYPITITGEGSLQAEGSTAGIVSHATITITNTTVTATGELDGIYSEGTVKIEGSSDVAATGTGSGGKGIVSAGEVRIEGSSKVHAKGYVYAIYGFNGITIGDGLAITEPVNWRISDDGYIYNQKGQIATSVTIERVVKMNGDGTADSPYEITSYADLQEFASIVNGKHQAPQNTAACGKLMDNITCDDKDWVPIGKDQTNPYEGHFNGNNQVIFGLSNADITDVSPYQGLFGVNKGTVENVGIKSGNIKGNNDIGGVVGYNYAGTITNCYNTGAVSGTGKRVGGVAGINVGTITNCYNTGAVSGEGDQVGGVVGDNNGEKITNCYNTGAVSGKSYVGGVAGANSGDGTITNCYNTGAVSGTGSYVGGVAGHNGGGITNCYNTGEVSVGGSYVGGVAGYNTSGNIQRGEITNCYNTGAVSGDNYVGGVVGRNNGGTITNCYNTGAVRGAGGIVGGVAGWQYGGTITNCYYDKTFSTVIIALGGKVDTDTVKGLETSQMTGTAALDNNNMLFSFADGEKNPWIVKANGKDADSRTYYEYYPHLKGFAYDDSKKAADWPVKLIVDTTWKESASYTYNASDQKPTVTRITVSQKPVEVPEGKTAEYSRRTDEDWEALSSAPTDPGTYKMTVKDGGKVIDEIVFIILKPGEDGDYSVKYQTADGAPVGEAGAINVGKYKAIVQFTMSGLPRIEKEFQIKPAPLTIKAKDQTLTYNGQIQGEGDTAFDDPAQIDEKVAVSGLQGSDTLTSIVIDGQGTEIGKYPIVPFAAGIEKTDGNYDITYVDGTLMITPIPLKVTISGSSAKKTYNGKQQTYKGTVAAKSSDPAFDASKFRYKGSTVAKGTKAGVYTTKLATEGCVYNDPHYELNVMIGSPVKLTITEKNPEPKPQPKIDKAAAKIALDAGIIAKSSGSKVTASWGAVKGASSYVIYANYCDQKKCKKIKTVSGKTTSFNITKLNGKKFNPKKNLKFYVVAYTTVKGKKVKLAKSIMAHAPGSKNSKRTNVTGVKVKKASFTLKKGKTAKIKAKLVLQKKNRKPLKHCAKFRYASSNKKVAKVSKKGKITAVGKGKCTVYVYAVSGVSKKIKITVVK